MSLQFQPSWVTNFQFFTFMEFFSVNSKYKKLMTQVQGYLIQKIKLMDNLKPYLTFQL